jgi:hypothetical protein
MRGGNSVGPVSLRRETCIGQSLDPVASVAEGLCDAAVTSISTKGTLSAPDRRRMNTFRALLSVRKCLNKFAQQRRNKPEGLARFLPSNSRPSRNTRKARE